MDRFRARKRWFTLSCIPRLGSSTAIHHWLRAIIIISVQLLCSNLDVDYHRYHVGVTTVLGIIEAKCNVKI